MSAPSPSAFQPPTREMIHESLRGWPALHTYVLPDDQPPRTSGGEKAPR